MNIMNTVTTTLLQLSIFISVVLGGHHWKRNNDVEMEINEARTRVRQNWEKLWNKTHDAVVDSNYDLLKLLTESTLEQAKEAVHSVVHYTNLTRQECKGLKQKIPQHTKAMSIRSCIDQAEVNMIKSYKMTGYNLHTCIRNSQSNIENQYQQQVQVLQSTTRDITASFHHYHRTLENCADPNCVLTTVLQSVVEYERLHELIARNITELHNLSTRYILTYIAVGCVGNSNLQLEHNFEVGKNFARGCMTTEPQAQT